MFAKLVDKRVKIIAAAILAVIVVLGIAVSIIFRPSYRTYVTDVSDNSFDYLVAIEKKYDQDVSLLKDGAQNCSVTVDGNTYHGEYKGVRQEYNRSYASYSYNDPTTDASFSIRSDTQQLISFSLRGSAGFKQKQLLLENVANPEMFASNKATEIAKTYLSNINTYETQVETKTTTVDLNGESHILTYYSVKFFKVICGITTSDYCIVNITEKGSLYSILVSQTGGFDTLNFTNDTLTKVNEVVKEKSDDVLSKKHQGFSYERSEIRYQHLLCTTDGKILLVSEVIGHFKNVDSGEYETALIALSTEL